MILSIVHSWNNPLHHLVTELGGMKGAPDAILSRAKGVETINSELLENIMTILSKVSSLLFSHIFPTFSTEWCVFCGEWYILSQLTSQGHSIGIPSCMQFHHYDGHKMKLFLTVIWVVTFHGTHSWLFLCLLSYSPLACWLPKWENCHQLFFCPLAKHKSMLRGQVPGPLSL